MVVGTIKCLKKSYPRIDLVNIHDFLQNQVVSIFKHLQSTTPVIKKDIEAYLALMDPKIGMIYHHRKEYEESISKINKVNGKIIWSNQLPEDLTSKSSIFIKDSLLYLINKSSGHFKYSI